MNIEYRLAAENDLEGIYNVEINCFASPWQRESVEYDLCENENSLYLAALDESGVVGFCGVHIVLDECHINNLAVLPKFRRQGIGEELIKLLLSSTQQLIKMYWLEVRQGNDAAKKLYHKLGFEPVAVRPKYYSDTGEDALVMCRTKNRDE